MKNSIFSNRVVTKWIYSEDCLLEKDRRILMNFKKIKTILFLFFLTTYF
jgi:hypothetical protein